jgi:hypothetical protein
VSRGTRSSRYAVSGGRSDDAAHGRSRRPRADRCEKVANRVLGAAETVAWRVQCGRLARLIAVVLPAAVLVGLLLVLCLPGRAAGRARTAFKLAPSSLWALDHVCLSMQSLLREWPELAEVRVDLTSLSTLDEASIASVKRAIETTVAAGVRLRFDGCDGHMAGFLLLRGVRGEHLGPLRGARVERWKHFIDVADGEKIAE